MNALMGYASPGRMGFDIAHINVHKTLSTPHGGGGPGLVESESNNSLPSLHLRASFTMGLTLESCQSRCFSVTCRY